MTRVRAFLIWLVDVLLVAAFVAAGRGTHGEGPEGFATTFLPFLVGLQTGWLIRTGQSALAPIRSGVPIWLSTVVLGLLLRVATGDTAALPFVIVATLTLGAALVGWRALGTGVDALLGRRGKPASADSSPHGR